uniref:Uncharacterized protein n=1 Tax=Aegilops tauschii subsp. strangulata TaxID=200361 RepID=A0A453A4L0_AEGTS
MLNRVSILFLSLYFVGCPLKWYDQNIPRICSMTSCLPCGHLTSKLTY